MINLDNIATPKDHCMQVAQRLKLRRKELGFSQQQLATKSGVSLGSLRRFEQTGEISFHSLARIAQALGCEGDLDMLFAKRMFKNIQEVIDAQGK